MHLVSPLVSILVARTLQGWYDWRQHQPGRDLPLYQPCTSFNAEDILASYQPLYPFQYPGPTSLIYQPKINLGPNSRSRLVWTFLQRYPTPGTSSSYVLKVYGPHVPNFPGFSSISLLDMLLVLGFVFPLLKLLIVCSALSGEIFCLDFNPFFFFSSLVCSLAGCFSFINLLILWLQWHKRKVRLKEEEEKCG